MECVVEDSRLSIARTASDDAGTAEVDEVLADGFGCTNPGRSDKRVAPLLDDDVVRVIDGCCDGSRSYAVESSSRLRPVALGVGVCG